MFASSCFPLVPYSNRIENGTFTFEGQELIIKKNHPGNIYPIHGNVWEHSWTVEHVSGARCVLSVTYHPETGGWPWAYQARQIIELEGAKLRIELSITNTGRRPFPAGLGLHPSFSNAKTAQVKFKAQSMWASDKQLDLRPQTSSIFW